MPNATKILAKTWRRLSKLEEIEKNTIKHLLYLASVVVYKTMKE